MGQSTRARPGLVGALALAASLWAASFRSQLAYRANFVLWMTSGIVWQGVPFLFIWVVLTRFDAIAGWSLGEVAFLYGLRVAAHAVCVLFLYGDMQAVAWYLVREGNFDRYLVRPMPSLLQIISGRVWVGSFGELLGAILLLAAAQALAGVSWSATSLIYLVLAILGGAMAEASLQIIFASLSFRLMDGGALNALADEFVGSFASYPLAIFGHALRLILTFGVPIAFIAYLPATVLLERTGELSIHPLFAYAAPLIGAGLFGLAYLFWHNETRHYQSTGS